MSKQGTEYRADPPHLTKQGYTSTFGDDAEKAAAVAKQERSKHKDYIH
jgi:hypothetical protein